MPGTLSDPKPLSGGVAATIDEAVLLKPRLSETQFQLDPTRSFGVCRQRLDG
jgi:hypothetical protein